ncbi:hypothetical protein ACLMJK_008927 [Lecanora helva]
MALSRKRSLSDMQGDGEGLSSKMKDDETYRLMVLQTEETEDELDEHFRQTALELGISIPQDLEPALDLVTSSVSALHLNPDPPEPNLPPAPLEASPSIHTASDSSIEQQRHRKTPSLAATSITSASLSSVASSKSNLVKVRKGFRRISRFHKRKVSENSLTKIPSRASSMLQIARPGFSPQRTITDDHVSTMSDFQPHAISTNQMQTLPVPRTPVTSTSGDPNPTRPQFATAPQSSLERPSLQDIAGRRRSISNEALKKLRASQLQEQLRFISFKATQKRLLRMKHIQRKRDALAEYQNKQKDIQARHAEALTALENRHLTAEVELNKTLQMERQSCETRLKHMQAYCNPRSNVQGMPERVVTKADYRQLEQQYHIRNGMDNLHTSRINVLRERQGKQLERIMAKQETETENMEADLERQNQEFEVMLHADEVQLEAEFAERKKRLVSRWELAEVIERKRLELESGEEHGPLPPIMWSSDSDARSSGPPSPVSSRGTGSRGRSRDGPFYEANTSFDAMNMI